MSGSWKILGVYGDGERHRGQPAESESYTADFLSLYLKGDTDPYRKNSGTQPLCVKIGGEEFALFKNIEKKWGIRMECRCV